MFLNFLWGPCIINFIFCLIRFYFNTKQHRNAINLRSINNMLRSFVKTCKYHHNDIQAFNIENPSIS